MIYFCADDYGISHEANLCLEACLKNGVLNKISVLPNGEISDLGKCSLGDGETWSLHLNLIEGKPISDPSEIDVLVDKSGFFKYSFLGLLLMTLSPKRKKVKDALYKEIQNQIKFWQNIVKDGCIFSIDSHQHTHMIPLVFKTLMQVIKDEGVDVDSIRIPDEPILPYILTPSLYFSYSITGAIKQWVLKCFAFLNKKELKKSKIPSAYFMGVMFSGKLNEIKILHSKSMTKRLLLSFFLHLSLNKRN